MSKFQVLLTACAFTLIGLSSASARAYVDAQNGNDSGTCPVTSPCATLNFALSLVNASSNETIVIMKAGNFGPIYLTGNVFIVGTDPTAQVQIYADQTALVGCIGGAPGSCGANNGYAVEIAAGVNDVLGFSHVLLTAEHHGVPGVGALKFTSGGKIQLSDCMFHGNATATTPMILLAPNNPGTTQAQVYFSHSDVGFNNPVVGGDSGAVSVAPIGNTSLKLHFNHVEVHNAAYGIRTDGSALSAGANVSTFISESEFFSFPNAAVNAFSTSGTGTVNAVFDSTRILNANEALKANGPLSFVILTNNTVGGNNYGVHIFNGATVVTSVNNTITGNGPSNNQNVVIVSGTYSNAPLQ